MDRIELLKQAHKKTGPFKSCAVHTEKGSAGPVKAKKPRAGRPAGSTTAKKGGPRTNRTYHQALRLTEETGKAVEAAAYDTHRTNSNWIETAILWALDQGAVHTKKIVPRP